MCWSRSYSQRFVLSSYYDRRNYLISAMSKDVYSMPRGNVYLSLNPNMGDNIHIELAGKTIIWRISYGMKIMQCPV